MPSSVELQRGLQYDELLGSCGLGEGILRRVQTVNVGLMMLAMVKFHDFLRDVWLEGLHA